jgi:predicted ATP-dependent endonuclease of OLD family
MSFQPKYIWSMRPNKERPEPTKWQHTYLPTSRLYVSPDSARPRPSNESVLSEEQLDTFYAGSLQELWSRYTADIDREVRKIQEDGLANILKAILSSHSTSDSEKNQKLVDPITAYKSAAAFLKRQGSPATIGKQNTFEKNYSENIHMRSVVSDIYDVEQKIEKSMAPRNRLQQLIGQMFSGNKTVTFGDKEVTVESGSNTPIKLSLLSSGEKHLLRIFIESLNAKENSAIIDEPELSLHIDWQRELIGAMQHLNPSAQYIVATHSPEIMANVDDTKIFRL